MSKNISSIKPGATLAEAAVLLRDADVGILPVVDAESKLVGLITDRDIVVRGVAEERTPSTATVADVMSTDLHTVGPDDFAFRAVRLMGENQVRRIPIVDEENKLVGIVSIADIALEMEDEIEIAETLGEISTGAAFWGKR